ncbi:MliC family protein [Benzoatithermus flavus]|uniref:MliC family protein n=1 Tax=Benzoatithermus flavus TaxID=3108223 RepID=A0ABU8XQB1_9PROT
MAKDRRLSAMLPSAGSGRTRSGPGVALAGCLVLLAGCGRGEAPPASVADLAWRCADGHVLRVLFQEEQNRAVLTTSKDALTLTRSPADRGRRFTAPGWELWAVRDEALFTYPGGVQTYCRYRPWFDS